MEHHAQWKGFPWTWGNWWIATRVNVVEFLLWMGPLIVIFVSAVRASRKTLLVFLLLFGGLLLFGKAAGEVARLWLFVMPFVWMTAFPEMNDKDAPMYSAIMIFWTLLMKVMMDF